MSTVRALVITGFGINCEEEMAAGMRMGGAAADIVHLNAVLLGECRISAYDVLCFPGGFSFGDDLGAGKALANKIRYRSSATGEQLFDQLRSFLEKGGFIIGICNGFQALVKMGLLPNVRGSYEQEVTLTANDSGRFEDRWVHCAVTQGPAAPFLRNLDTLPLPVRHGEGKLLFADELVRDAVVSGSLNCLTYSDSDGRLSSDYPANPNGSELSCAGLVDPAGRVFGMMPHPEAFLSLYNHPDWGRLRRIISNKEEEGAGLAIFKNIVAWVESRKSTRDGGES